MLTPEGRRIQLLLSARGDESEGAELLRARTRAEIATKRIYEELLVILAENRWLHEESFPIIERLDKRKLDEQGMIIDEIVRLFGVNICEAIDVKEQRAGKNRWHTVLLLLPKLKELLNRPHPTSRKSRRPRASPPASAKHPTNQ